MSRITTFFAWLAGDPPSTVAVCAERAQMRSAAVGATVLVPVFIAATGAGATAYEAGLRGLPVVLTAAAWAFTVLVVDRVLLLTIVPGRTRRVAIIARLALLGVGSSLFAHVLLLQLFRGQLDAETATAVSDEIAAVEQRAAASEERLLKAPRARLLEQQGRRARFEASAERTREEIGWWRGQLDQETQGLRASGKRGRGSAAAEVEQQQIEPRLQQLAAAEAAVKQAALDVSAAEQMCETASHDPEVQRVRAERDRQIGVLRADRRIDVLSRTHALHRLARRDGVVAALYLLVLALLALSEATPLLAKLTAPPDALSRAVAAEDARSEAQYNSELEVLAATRAARAVAETKREIARAQLQAESRAIVDKVALVRATATELLDEHKATLKLADQHSDKALKPFIEAMIEALIARCAAAFADIHPEDRSRHVGRA